MFGHKEARYFINFPFYLLSSHQTFHASPLPTDWLSQLGLGNQVGSSADHLELLPTPNTDKVAQDEQNGSKTTFK